MSWLYPLDVQGAGTSDVEALSSYLLRLANVHATTAGTLLGVIQARYPSLLLRSHAGMLTSNVSMFIRPNKTTAAIVEMVAQATDCAPEALEATTFLSLSEALSRGMQVYSSRLRWCPMCLAEMRSYSSATTYFKLKWQVLNEYTCDIHRVRLFDRCRACDAAQDSYGSHRDIGLCVRCSTPLSTLERGDFVEGGSATDIRDLVGYIATRGRVRFPAQGVIRVLKELHDEAHREGRVEHLYRLIPRHALIRFISQRDSMTLQTALRISSSLGVPVLELLGGELQGINRQLILEQLAQPIFLVGPVQRRAKLEPEQLLKDVIEAEDTLEGCPKPSLKTLAKEVGVSTGALWYHLPDRTRELASKYKAIRDDHRKRVHDEVQEAVHRSTQEWSRTNARTASGKALLRKLYSETGLPKNLLREEICRVMLKLMV